MAATPRWNPVNWRVWRHEDWAELWKVVAVSLNLSPDGIDLVYAAEIFPKRFHERLRDAVKHLGEKLPVFEYAEWRPLRISGLFTTQIIGGPPGGEEDKVRLTAFADLAYEMGWKLPSQFPRLPQIMAASERQRAEDNLKLANQKRFGDAEALKDIVAELDRKHPEWSHAQMARELESLKIGHHKSGKPYSARRIGQIRKFGRKFPVKG